MITIRARTNVGELDLEVVDVYGDCPTTEYEDSERQIVLIVKVPKEFTYLTTVEKSA